MSPVSRVALWLYRWLANRSAHWNRTQKGSEGERQGLSLDEALGGRIVETRDRGEPYAFTAHVRF
jgi:hypothetical protein